MIATQMEPLIQKLDQRRKELGMTYAALARLAGVSMTSTVRILSGQHSHAGFAPILAIAEVLGMSIDATPRAHVNQMREQRAREKAERLVSMVQATSALEAQAVSSDDLSAMTRQTTHELMAGSPRKLWSE